MGNGCHGPSGRQHQSKCRNVDVEVAKEPKSVVGLLPSLCSKDQCSNMIGVLCLTIYKYFISKELLLVRVLPNLTNSNV